MLTNEIIKIIEHYAPPHLASDYDNVGLMLGSRNRDVKTVLLALDVDLQVAMEAKAIGAELIISHHPLIFNPIKRITTDTSEGQCILFLAENQISVYAAHTNLDSAQGGLNDLAAQFLSLMNVSPLEGNGETGIGRIGTLPFSITLGDLVDKIKQIYRLPFIRFIGAPERFVSNVALCTGSGGDLLNIAEEKGADVYITGDIKYSVARDAYNGKTALIELGHYESEIIAMDLLAKILAHYLDTSINIYKSKANINVFNTR